MATAIATPVASSTAAPATPAASPSGTPAAGADANVPQVPGVKITIHKAGSGDPIAKGSKGSFHYTGWLEGFESVKKFDSSKDRNQPFDVALGQGMVIPGWDQGLIGMLPGEIRRLEIAPEMGYGANGSPPVIPPNATLFFEVEYLGPAQ
jgi:FKBP-type peptidyl-prolyl cis-trans isomerase FkpA